VSPAIPAPEINTLIFATSSVLAVKHGLSAPQCSRGLKALPEGREIRPPDLVARPIHEHADPHPLACCARAATAEAETALPGSVMN